MAQADANAQFVALANEYIAEFLELEPEFATYQGEHRYDHRLSDVSRAGLIAKLSFHKSYLGRLNAINAGALSGANRIDYRILQSRMEGQIWSLTELREHEWNPMTYNPGNAIYLLLEREFAPLPKRLESVRARLEAVPRLFEAAKQNLRTATRIHTETAIGQTKGVINLYRTVLGGYLEKAPSMKASIAPVQEKAIRALEAWSEWLAKDLMPRATRDFRIGPDLYRAKLRFSLDSGLTPEQIGEQARKDLADTHAVMYETARKLYKGSSTDRHEVIRDVLNKLAEKRPTAATIVEQSRRELADATAFVRKQNLVSVYDTPLRIVEMPEFQRGVAVASCASPGPLEKNGITFFNISPPPANWNQQQVDSYFREYNDYMVRNLTVHEAMPGHYLQRAHANRFEAPTLVRALFWSGSFTEGWAVYAERIMAERGYGGPEVRMQQQKMRLRMIINAIIDQGVHTKGMTEQQAMDLMMNDGFQERSEAAGKWRRASLTSAQLSTYYVGATELDQLREDYIRKYGPVKDWKAFHDKLLSFGSPAPRYARELMGV
jgi:uncharacterized protein (DUF885 family)